MTEADRGPALSFGPVSSFRWRTGAQDKGLSLDEAVSDYLRISKEEAADLIDFGSVYVRGLIERNPSRVVSGGEEISVTFPSYGVRRFYEIDPIRVIFRDRSLFAYDKEARYSEPTDALRRLQQCFCGPASPSGKGENLRALRGPPQQARQGNERHSDLCARKGSK